MSVALASLRRVCSCGHVHYATVCHVCKKPDPSYQRLYVWTAAHLRALRIARPGQRLVRLLESGCAGIGIAALLLLAMAWWARDDLGAWYRTLPVVVAAKYCPGSEQP